MIIAFFWLKCFISWFKFHLIFLSKGPTDNKWAIAQEISSMGLLPDTWNCRLRMRLECRANFPRHRLQRKPLVSDPDMHHGTCMTHVPWCMSGSLTRRGGENVLGISDTCATHNCMYLARGPLNMSQVSIWGRGERLAWWTYAPLVPNGCTTLRPRRNGQLLTDDIFKRTVFYENVWIAIKISLNFVSKGQTVNIAALVQIKAWHWPSDKPLSERILVKIPTHICVTWSNTHFSTGLYTGIAL